MRNYYYRFWANALAEIKSADPYDKYWKERTFFYINFAISLNYWTILAVLKLIGLDLPQLEFEIGLPFILEQGISFFINYYLLFAIINYFLLFANNRYETVIKGYEDGKGTYLWYILISLFIPLIIVLFVDPPT